MNRKVLGFGVALVVPLLAILVVNLGRDPQRIDSPLIGRPAPPFSLAPVGGGEPLTLDKLRGRPAVLNFWATWCAPCYEEHPVLQASARTLGPDVQFVGIVYEDQEENVRSYLRSQGSAYPNFMDAGGRAAIAYGVSGVPETYFISPDGAIVDKFSGPLDARSLADRVARTRAARSASR
ncbi:MAG TPA: redoxin domain-containing protein [Vicinamibacteria bacterium]|nr:redoxin domain-containing protein [Vicinamibacteria bacterium]